MITRFLALFIALFFAVHIHAQTDTSTTAKAQARVYSHRDSVQLARLNSSGNLMIAAGVGLCGASGYLLYYGITTYKALPSDPASPTYQAQVDRNKRQGTIYIAAGSIAAAAGIILTAFGARNKVDFKNRKRLLEMESGILQSGNLGLALNF